MVGMTLTLILLAIYFTKCKQNATGREFCRL